VQITLNGRQRAEVASGITALRAMEMTVVALGYMFDMNTDVGKRAREMAVYGDAEAVEAARIGSVEGAAREHAEAGT